MYETAGQSNGPIASIFVRHRNKSWMFVKRLPSMPISPSIGMEIVDWPNEGERYEVISIRWRPWDNSESSPQCSIRLLLKDIARGSEPEYKENPKSLYVREGWKLVGKQEQPTTRTEDEQEGS